MLKKFSYYIKTLIIYYSTVLVHITGHDCTGQRDMVVFLPTRRKLNVVIVDVSLRHCTPDECRCTSQLVAKVMYTNHYVQT